MRGGWKTKPYETASAKSRSENEGLDSMANGLTEIEAGDVRDGKTLVFFSLFHVQLTSHGVDSSIFIMLRYFCFLSKFIVFPLLSFL